MKSGYLNGAVIMHRSLHTDSTEIPVSQEHMGRAQKAAAASSKQEGVNIGISIQYIVPAPRQPISGSCCHSDKHNLKNLLLQASLSTHKYSLEKSSTFLNKAIFLLQTQIKIEFQL